MATPDELLVAANEIVAIATTESLYRAAINRLYYATFHKCYLYHVALPQPGTVGAASGKHNQLINQLNYPSPGLSAKQRATSIAVGKTLRVLCGQRVTSDYELGDVVTVELMMLSSNNAKTIFSNI